MADARKDKSDATAGSPRADQRTPPPNPPEDLARPVDMGVEEGRERMQGETHGKQADAARRDASSQPEREAPKDEL